MKSKVILGSNGLPDFQNSWNELKSNGFCWDVFLSDIERTAYSGSPQAYSAEHSAPNSSMDSTIELDLTLKQLYDSDSGSHSKVYLAYVIPTAQVQMTSGIPISIKYAYQDPFSHKDSDLQARIFAQVVPQLFGIIAGKMNLIMFDLDSLHGEDFDPQPRIDTAKVMSQLVEDQRPLITYTKKASDIFLPPNAVLAVSNPMDCLEYLPAAVPPEQHYRALSKRELVFSGLPTPHSTVVDTILSVEEVQESGLRAIEVTRMLQFIKEKAPPYVIKLPQALSGQGTFLIRNECDRSDALAVLLPEFDRMLRQLNGENAHLSPVSFIIQEMVAGSAIAISLFVTKSGEPIVTSCCDQFIDSSGHWDGGHINYAQQSRLKAEYMPIAQTLAASIHSLGYHGPLGADIMTGPDGKHLIIDLNTRVTGSHPLGFLSNHFSVKRGFFDAAVFFPLFLNVTLEEFKYMFLQEFEQGRIVVAGWCHERGGKSSVTTLILAGETQERLSALAVRVKALKTSGY